MSNLGHISSSSGQPVPQDPSQKTGPSSKSSSSTHPRTSNQSSKGQASEIARQAMDVVIGQAAVTGSSLPIRDLTHLRQAVPGSSMRSSTRSYKKRLEEVCYESLTKLIGTPIPSADGRSQTLPGNLQNFIDNLSERQAKVYLSAILELLKSPSYADMDPATIFHYAVHDSFPGGKINGYSVAALICAAGRDCPAIRGCIEAGTLNKLFPYSLDCGLDVVQALIDFGANVDTQDKSGDKRTLLMKAVLRLDVPLVKLLLEVAGARTDIRDANGQTALLLINSILRTGARSERIQAIQNLLLAHGQAGDELEVDEEGEVDEGDEGDEYVDEIDEVDEGIEYEVDEGDEMDEGIE